MKNQPLDRLLRAAATLPNEPPEIPFGFETRVVASWRALPVDPAGVVRLLHRVVFTAVALILLAGAGVYHEFAQSEEHGEIISSDFAIADSAVGGAFE